jgi:peptidoglycan/LPS O-acetylase OafA/YrhL
VTQTGRIASLDGLRAISVALVVANHSPIPVEGYWERVVKNGSLGVSTFFVLSGYLITRLLLEHPPKTLGAFYLRRARRIMPAFYLFLAVVGLLGWLHVVDFSARAYLASLLFVRNYLPTPAGLPNFVTLHCWSLAVEEHFYLLWPLVVLAWGRRGAVWVAVALVIAGPALRALTYALLPALRGNLTYMTHTRIDTLMVGCLAALRYPKAIGRGWLAALSVVFLLFASPWLSQRFGGTYAQLAGRTLEALAILVVLVWAMEHPPRWLNHPLLVHVGLISYSLYLWQELFLTWTAWWAYPAMLITAELSYRFIEQRFRARGAERVPA